MQLRVTILAVVIGLVIAGCRTTSHEDWAAFLKAHENKVSATETRVQPGDVIVGLDKTAVSGMDDFFNAVMADTDSIALLDVFSRGSMRYVPVDTSVIRTADQVQDQQQAQSTLRQKIFSTLTGGTPFSTDDEEEGPKGGKFADGNVALASENAAFNRPSEVPGDINTGGGGPSDITGMNRPSEVPPQIGGPNGDIVLFVGLLLLVILYLAYREFHRPPEPDEL